MVCGDNRTNTFAKGPHGRLLSVICQGVMYGFSCMYFEVIFLKQLRGKGPCVDKWNLLNTVLSYQEQDKWPDKAKYKWKASPSIRNLFIRDQVSYRKCIQNSDKEYWLKV